MWVAAECRRLLTSKQHLILNAMEVVSECEGVVFPDCIFWKLDVKDFYLMGTADELGFLVIPDGPNLST